MTRVMLQRWVMLGVLLLVVIGAAVAVLLLQPQPSPSELRAQELAKKLDHALDRPRTNDVPGVAVFSFTAPAEDKDLVHLGRMLCDAIVERLLREGALRLTSCASAQVAAEAGVQGAQLAHLLGVEHAVQGSVARLADGRFRTAVAMRQLRDGTEQWRIEEDADEARLQQMIGQITTRVGETAGRPLRNVGDRTIDARAYARYLKAMQLAARKNPEELREAQKLIDEVLASEPDYAPALYARLGLMSQLSGFRAKQSADKSEAEMLAEQERLLREIQMLGRRLVELDPGDMRGNVLLLNFAFQNRRWLESFGHADILLQHRARHPGVLRIYARLNLAAGYIAKARERALDAARLDALNAETYEVLALIHGVLGDDARMRDFASIASELGVRRTAIFDSMAAYRRSDWTAFGKSFPQWARDAEQPVEWVPKFVLAVSDPSRREPAIRALDQQDEGTRSIMAGYFFEYALLGDVERSLRSVRHHAKLPPARWLEELWWPELSAVRQHGGFAQALDDLGLPLLWDARGAPDLCSRRPGDGWRCR